MQMTLCKGICRLYSVIMCTRITHGKVEDETARERTGHPSQYAEAKK